MSAWKPIATVLICGLALSVASAQRRDARRAPPPPQGQRGPGNAPGYAQRQEQRPASPGDQRPQQEHRFILHGPGPHMGDWLRRHENQPADQQMKALEQDPGFRSLPSDRQQQLRNRLQRFNSLPPDQKDTILQRMETFEHLTPEQQQRARNLFRDFRSLPEPRRRMVMQAFRDLQTLSPQERQRTIDSESFRNVYTDQERELLRGMSEIGIGPRPAPNQ